MNQRLFYLLLGCLLVVSIFAHHALERLSTPSALPLSPKRIVSLAPSVTETLYALGMGEEVIGVTQFCAYPPEAANKPQVAGFSDINYEEVVRLRPDLVMLPLDKVQSKQHLERLGLPVLLLDTRSLSGFAQAVERLGEVTGHRKRAASLLAALQHNINEAGARAVGRARPKVLVSVMHSYQGLGFIHEVNVVGSDGFYSELIKAAGGDNVYQGQISFPRLSREALIFLNPEVIIDIIPPYEDIQAVRKDWESLHTVRAIQNNRLFIFTDEGDSVPGPRSGRTLAKLSQAFHSDVIAAQ